MSDLIKNIKNSAKAGIERAKKGVQSVKEAARTAVEKAQKAFANLAPSPKAKCPPPKLTAADLLKNANVKAGLKRAAADSNIGGKNPVEQGGFILRNPKNGALSVERWPSGEGASMQPPLSKDGKWNGKDIVGSFHTHPNVGPGWQPQPSKADINFVKNYPKTAGEHHFVISQKTVYHIDKKGSYSAVGKTSSILK